MPTQSRGKVAHDAGFNDERRCKAGTKVGLTSGTQTNSSAEHDAAIGNRRFSAPKA
jgi:hypothetical protein